MSRSAFLARLLVLALGWGVAWAISKAVGIIAPNASIATFYGLGGIFTVVSVLRLIREHGRQLVLREMEGEQPAHRYVPIVSGLFWIAVGAVLWYLLYSTENTFWGWARWAVSIAPMIFGVDSLRCGLFGSDKEIRTLVSGEAWPPATMAHRAEAGPRVGDLLTKKSDRRRSTRTPREALFGRSANGHPNRKARAKALTAGRHLGGGTSRRPGPMAPSISGPSHRHPDEPEVRRS